jgi:hypothetical protein
MGTITMETRPPALAEAVAGRLIPPGSRESVLGDLSESYTTLSRYVFETVNVVARLVLRRLALIVKTESGLLASEGGLFLTALAHPQIFRAGVRSAPMLEIPAVVMFLALLVLDAYIDTDVSDRSEQAFESALARSFRDVSIAIGFGWLVEIAVRTLARGYGVTNQALFDLSAFCFLMCGAIRTAWWALYIPGTRRFRLKMSDMPEPPSEEELRWKSRRLQQDNVGQIAWMAVGCRSPGLARWSGLTAAAR